MVLNDRILCRELIDSSDPLFRASERLYLETQQPDERIPWKWIEHAINRASVHPSSSHLPHLMAALPEEQKSSNSVAGFAYGTFLPGFGGYISYLGVSEKFRRRGVGTRLFNEMFKAFATDARRAGETLPFVVWESRKPDPLTATEKDWQLWDSRVRLFDNVGALWLDGLELQSPNFAEASDIPVPLQLFVRPIDLPALSFDADKLIEVAMGLMRRIYKSSPGDELYDATLARSRPIRPRRAYEGIEASRSTKQKEKLHA